MSTISITCQREFEVLQQQAISGYKYIADGDQLNTFMTDTCNTLELDYIPGGEIHSDCEMRSYCSKNLILRGKQLVISVQAISGLLQATAETNDYFGYQHVMSGFARRITNLFDASELEYTMDDMQTSNIEVEKSRCFLDMIVRNLSCSHKQLQVTTLGPATFFCTPSVMDCPVIVSHMTEAEITRQMMDTELKLMWSYFASTRKSHPVPTLLLDKPQNKLTDIHASLIDASSKEMTKWGAPILKDSHSPRVNVQEEHQGHLERIQARVNQWLE
jgi:hypothetical protein